MTAEKQRADRERNREFVEASELDKLSRMSSELLASLLVEAKGEVNCEHDPFVLRHWELSVARLQHELAIRNRRETEALDTPEFSAADRETLRFLRDVAESPKWASTTGQDRLAAEYTTSMRSACELLSRLLGEGPMGDLTEEELDLATTVGTRLEMANRRAYVDRDTLNLADRLQRAALELVRYRSVRAADVRAIVTDCVTRAVDAALGEVSRQQGGVSEQPAREARRDGIAAGTALVDAMLASPRYRVAEQLSASPGLSDDVVRGLQLMRGHLDDGGHDWRTGTAMADVQAAREWLDRLLGAKPC